ncbi:MAG: DUF4824 family protein [Betaproteobacteria bacterium]|nr:DUF4824 family protein [Betaproteobacteria bacterium]
MIAWSRRRTLIAGAALIVLTNAVALGGVAWNRSAPESSLRLTQRELWLPWGWGFEAENSGLALRLVWRAPAAGTEEKPAHDMSYLMIGGAPAWLDEVKLAELGFDVSRSEDSTTDRARFEKQLPREVLLVLELDGPAYRQSLERTRKFAEAEKALLAANPGKKEFEERARRAREQFGREEGEASRLFAVDASLDAAALRAKYSDRSRYALVRGQVRPQFAGYGKSTRLAGYVSRLSVESVNVPHEFRGVLEPVLQRGAGSPSVSPSMKAAPFEATVAFGRRFEPWMTAAARGAGAAGQALGPRQ